MAILYRLETNEMNIGYRRGAYRSVLAEIALEEYGYDSSDSSLHPGPYNDVGLAIVWGRLPHNHRYRFGFSSLDQYRNWFLSEQGREDILNLGVIGVYHVPDEYYHIGQFQAIAHKDHMQHLGDMPTNTLADIHPFSMEYLWAKVRLHLT